MRNSVACGLLLLVAAVALADAPQPARPSTGDDGSVERPFAAGGVVRMNLSAGEYRIEGAPANRILVRWRTRKPGDARRVRVQVDVEGSRAVVRTRGPRGDFDVDIQVPSPSDLDLELSAGDLAIRELAGNKNVDVWAGDVSIEVGDPTAYQAVDARVTFGDLAARPFNVMKGGIWRRFTWQGRGTYQLRARLFAGELRLLR